MKRLGSSSICFGLGVVLTILLVLLGAQEGLLKSTFAANPSAVATTSSRGFGRAAGQGCTNNDLNGMFGYYRIGATDVPAYVKNPVTKQLLPPSPPPPAPFSNPLASVGILEFYGTGVGASYQRTNKEGILSPSLPSVTTANTPIAGIDSTATKFSYSVSPDCTFLVYSDSFVKGYEAFVRTYAAQGVILGNGDEFYMLAMAPGSAVVVVAKRSPAQAREDFY